VRDIPDAARSDVGVTYASWPYPDYLDPGAWNLSRKRGYHKRVPTGLKNKTKELVLAQDSLREPVSL
jgi:hypothetical protein